MTKKGKLHAQNPNPSVRLAVVPAAGIGSRLLPLTKAQPKEMLPLGRRPVLHYVIEELAGANICRILLITGRRKRSVEDYFDEDGDLRHFDPDKVPTAEKLGVSLAYMRQPQPLGSGHAVSLAASFTGNEPFLVAYGDCVIWESTKGSLVREMIAAYEQFKPAAVIAVQKVPRAEVQKYGVVAAKGWKDGVAKVEAIVEKPKPEEAPSTYAVAARYLFTPRIYEALEAVKPENGEWQLTDAIQKLIDWGETVLCVRLGDRKRFDVGSFKSYCIAFIHAATHDPEIGQDLVRELKRMLRKVH
ncbi:sugar phosphate nucleotidyltransferase [Fervidibacter sacchari]|jgi:UDP-glucose pyrophosphorylase|uniref:UTP--glucose-1-phosphate uridylyltransferase n=1 Tax=Candidatus Fervidibacter sacchari TaxID=1448929 RepID=A0ABT2ELW3_9BACT|nr:sugar phosphate nucleotidyltransferase [Candidatus Fervidibacter sacchari]MCS3918937.1 UTP--glucose-1-phosphate uridylyltransferase [Candidatus Fervidibacter sacchari]WKU17324.1 sugar phosphate nucleotidyltransferase [Candidatus Fervidibacter sacchari]